MLQNKFFLLFCSRKPSSAFFSFPLFHFVKSFFVFPKLLFKFVICGCDAIDWVIKVVKVVCTLFHFFVFLFLEAFLLVVNKIAVIFCKFTPSGQIIFVNFRAVFKKISRHASKKLVAPAGFEPAKTPAWGEHLSPLGHSASKRRAVAWVRTRASRRDSVLNRTR